MKNFIKLTKPNGERITANINHIRNVCDVRGERKDENTYISGINNNGGMYVREDYNTVLTLIEKAS